MRHSTKHCDMTAEEIIARLVERIEHLQDQNGNCDCFDCFHDREEHERLMKAARRLADKIQP